MFKRRIPVLLVFVALMVVAAAVPALAGGKKNTTEITFQTSSETCTAYFQANPNGMIHEWRDDASCNDYAGEPSLHLVFQPVGDKWPAADCKTMVYDDALTTWVPNPDFLGAIGPWSYNQASFSLGGDELTALGYGGQYWVCFYAWN